MKNIVKGGLVLAALIAVPSIASAQATPTWVSGVGDDVNPCSRTAPCKTFAGAISKTAAGGEINTLDPGGFGTVTITKSITIGTDPSMGGILSTSTNGIVINAAATDVITLRGLGIQGTVSTSPGLNGIRILNAGTVNIVNSTIQGTRNAAPNGNGILVANSANIVELNLDNVTLSENGVNNDGAGILVVPTGSGSAKVSVNNSALFNNVRGIRGDSSGTTGSVEIAVTDTTVSASTLSAFSVVSGASSPATLLVNRSTATGNASGINANGAAAVVRVTGSAITANTSAAAGGRRPDHLVREQRVRRQRRLEQPDLHGDAALKTRL